MGSAVQTKKAVPVNNASDCYVRILILEQFRATQLTGLAWGGVIHRKDSAVIFRAVGE